MPPPGRDAYLPARQLQRSSVGLSSGSADERCLRSRQMPRPTRKKADPAAEATSTLMTFSTPSGCPSAETANERMRTVLNAARTAATDTTPTLTTRLKHPERNMLLSKRVGEGQSFPNPRWPAFQHFSKSASFAEVLMARRR